MWDLDSRKHGNSTLLGLTNTNPTTLIKHIQFTRFEGVGGI